MSTRPLALLLALVALAPLAAAEDASPTDAFAKAAAALPAPSAEGGFTWRGTIRTSGSGGIGIGKILLSAEPAKLENGRPGWKLVEQYLPNGLMDRKAVAWVRQDLAPVRGELREKRPGGSPTTVRWTRTDEGFRVERVTETKEETAKESRVAEHAGTSLTTMTALWLFCRLGMAESGSLETTIFEPSPDRGSKTFETGRWSFAGRGTWRGGEAWLMRGQKGRHKLAAGFHLETKAFLGCDFLDEKGQVTLAFVTDENAEKPKPSAFEAPGKTAEDAALTAAFALATGDVDLVGEIFHWPTYHADEKKAYEAKTADDPDAKPFPDVEAFKQQVLARFEKTLVKRDPAMITMGMEMARGQLAREALEGGRVRIRFPEMFRSMLLDVQEIDGAWHLVRIPPLPKPAEK